MRPVFIIGKQRSGTSWLANMLSNHKDIGAIINSKEGYEGIHESVFFSHVKYHFGSLDDMNNYIEFIESFKHSDYFRLSHISQDFLYRKRYKTYEEFFNELMTEFCEKENKKIWLEKSPAHALHLEDLFSSFENAKFIAVKRNSFEVLRSYYKLKGQNDKKYFLFKEVFRNVGYEKHINHFSKKNKNIMIVHYKDLLNNNMFVLQNIFDFLNIEVDFNVNKDKYIKNSSFKKEEHSERILTYIDKVLIIFFQNVFNLLPYKIYRLLNLLHIKLFKRKLPNWFYDKKSKELLKITK